MTKAYEYKIVTGQAAEVEKQVQGLSSSGWQLHGGLCMQTPNAPQGGLFAQAMIKEYEQPGAWG
jgi:hypothetical protein